MTMRSQDNNPTVLIYARTARASGSATGLQRQLDFAQDAASLASLPVTTEIAEVLPQRVSGEALAEIWAHDIVVVRDPSRLARSSFDLTAILRQVSRAGTEIVFADGTGRITPAELTPTFVTMLGVMTDLEHDRLVARLRYGRECARARREAQL